MGNVPLMMCYKEGPRSKRSPMTGLPFKVSVVIIDKFEIFDSEKIGRNAFKACLKLGRYKPERRKLSFANMPCKRANGWVRSANYFQRQLHVGKVLLIQHAYVYFQTCFGLESSYSTPAMCLSHL